MLRESAAECKDPIDVTCRGKDAAISQTRFSPQLAYG